MPGDEDRAKPAAPAAAPDREDQLSPARSLRESAARGGGQRIGNNGPVANPDLSFPAEPEPKTTEEPTD